MLLEFAFLSVVISNFFRPKNVIKYFKQGITV